MPIEDMPDFPIPECIKSDGTRKEMLSSIVGSPQIPSWLQERMNSFPPPDTDQDDFMEIFSAPRIVPQTQKLGLAGIRSMDISTGWDLLKEDVVTTAFEDICRRRPTVVVISPPCTAFSKMQYTNWNKANRNESIARAVAGIRLLDVAMWVAQLQITAGRFFVFEHPEGATSWDRPAVLGIKNMPGVVASTFDQCMFGLVSKVHKKPIQKRTIILSNLPGIASAFNNVLCPQEHEHQVCHGYEGGEPRSVHAQRYPDKMCQYIAEAVRFHVRMNKK